MDGRANADVGSPFSSKIVEPQEELDVNADIRSPLVILLLYENEPSSRSGGELMQKIKAATRIELDMMDQEQRRQLRKDYQAVVDDCEQWEKEEDHKRICGHYSYWKAMAHFGVPAICKVIEAPSKLWEILTKERNTDHLKQTQAVRSEPTRGRYDHEHKSDEFYLKTPERIPRGYNLYNQDWRAKINKPKRD